MPRAERRVLALRAGVGIARTRSRAEVARITGLRRARIARVERRGLARLRALARAGACARMNERPASRPPCPGDHPPVAGAPSRGRSHVLADRGSGGERRQSTSGGAPRGAHAQPPQRPAGGSSFDLSSCSSRWGSAFALAVAREVRRPS